jgi:hypothetical protein
MATRDHYFFRFQRATSMSLFFMLAARLFGSIALDTHHIEHDRMMDHAVEGCQRRHRILECVILPFSFIVLLVLLVEAILEAGSHLHQIRLSSSASLWQADGR